MFEKLVSFTKDVSDLPDRPAVDSAAALKAQFDAAPDEVRVYLNKLIDALKLTTAGDSGAKNIGATSISGLTGTDVQSLLESLNTLTAKKAQPAWTNLTLANNWVYLGSGATPQVSKNEIGEVEIKARIKGGTAAGPIAVGVLDPPYRPSETRTFTAWDGVNTPKRIDVEPNGYIMIPSDWSVNNTFLILDFKFRP